MFKQDLRNFIKTEGITQIELSDIIGDSQQAISDFLTKEGNPQKKTKEKYFSKLKGFKEYCTSRGSLIKVKKQKESITQDEISAIRNAILFNEDELLKDPVIKQWLENKIIKRENKLLKEIKEKK